MKKFDYLYGINPVLAALSANRRAEKFRLYLNVAERQGNNNNPKMEQLTKMAQSQNIKVKYLAKGNLSKFCGARPHQNVILKASPLAYQDVRKIDDVLPENGQK